MSCITIEDISLSLVVVVPLGYYLLCINFITI
uniref:Uncharacterized protein n=1 Tax=Siphoviridae sp. ct47y1 TaxID=2827775 RepID=A0A8S5T995_9CAUD|nr:MAG TPA: hypothetical protein [Siphoviridae sp. ct47y1]DAG11898.1 MAG TPA: hypothetical protein [Caudoviricetes sp.]DAI21140.1 MAG TPA: hypothetical protein [Caudoviricetes sp.]DAS29185.1 MAG TPA: hypothetical protein [Caudoviricetes sp.]DAZ05800.1 MAG TPA: hypothetical protein [Caudoviricetes sp.]